MGWRGGLCGTYLAVGLLAAGVAAENAARAATAPEPSLTRIYWDRYAVPHIYGPDVASVVRGLGYATMANHAELLLNKVARARGRLAEYFGPKAPDGEDYVAADTAVVQYGLRETAADWVARGGAAQAALLQAFCDGVNEYAARHPNGLPAALQPILPLAPADVTAIGAYTAYYLFEAGQSAVPALVASWQAGGTAAPAAHASRQAGSNAIVLGPSKSASGHAIIVANSHLPWGINQPAFNNGYAQGTQFMEAHLVVGDPAHPRLNASGVAWIGLPFLAEGFNDFAGWTHTANDIFNADLFRLTLDSADQSYRFGDGFQPLRHRTVKLKVRRRDGSTETRMVETYRSAHGPVVAIDHARHTALALRMAGIEQPASVMQYWKMLQATDLAGFRAALSAMQLPVFNVFFADRAGDIYYLFGGRQPVRACPFALTEVQGTLTPGIQDGANPACLWTRTLPFDALPQASNPEGGYFANGNEAPWYASFPRPASLDPSRFPSDLTPDGVDFRPQHLHAWLNRSGHLTRGQVLAGKNSTHLTLADRVLPDLLALAGKAAAGGDTVAGQAAAILSAWDRSAEADSVGGVLFEAWWNEVTADVLSGAISADHSLAASGNVHPAFAVPFDPARPLATPTGLAAENGTKLLADLDDAYATLATNFASAGGAAVPWGVAHRTTLAARRGAQQQTVALPLVTNDPLSGADDAFGGIRVVNPAFDTALGAFVSYGGESYIHVIEFTPHGAEGGSLLVYGNASRPNSPHIGDQAALFAQNQLRAELRRFSDVTAAAVSSEPY